MGLARLLVWFGALFPAVEGAGSPGLQDEGRNPGHSQLQSVVGARWVHQNCQPLWEVPWKGSLAEAEEA